MGTIGKRDSFEVLGGNKSLGDTVQPMTTLRKARRRAVCVEILGDHTFRVGGPAVSLAW